MSRVADEPVEPVEDRTPGSSRVATEQGHERLDEAKAGGDAAKNLSFDFKLNYTKFKKEQFNSIILLEPVISTKT